MKTFTKSILSLIVLYTLSNGIVTAQTWCTLTTGSYPCNCVNSYSSTSPVITNVTLNTINRTSAASSKENFVNTGASTTLTGKQAYTFSMAFTVDPSICLDYNIRVYVDWNLDHDFADVGETALSPAMISVASSATSATYTGTLTVPATATVGITRMRVAMKMGASGGHTLPDPCTVTDGYPLGWHGEVEDYTLDITSGSGIDELKDEASVSIYPNPISGSATISFIKGENLVNKQFVVYDVLGKKVVKMNIPNGEKDFIFEKGNLKRGLYFYKIISEKNTAGAGKLVIQ